MKRLLTPLLLLCVGMTAAAEEKKAPPKKITVVECPQECKDESAVKEFNIDKYLEDSWNKNLDEKKKYDPNLCLTAERQDSILWYSEKYEFRIASIHWFGSQTAGHPFHLHFPFPRRFGHKAVSGPISEKMAPQERGKCFKFKADIEIKQDGKVKTVDPHIYTGGQP